MSQSETDQHISVRSDTERHIEEQVARSGARYSRVGWSKKELYISATGIIEWHISGWSGIGIMEQYQA